MITLDGKELIRVQQPSRDCTGCYFNCIRQCDSSNTPDCGL